jgi:thiol-disulfide isomerase/thioredoxin/uncharacterized membrane protein YphA (DoxX/SURF4 family)
MDVAVLAVRLLLAGIFALAAATKLRDPAATARAITGLGGSGRLARPGKWVLPAVELAVVAALVITPLAVAGAIVAFLLLLVFTAAIVNALRLSRRPDCGCFGSLTARPVSIRTAGRNVALAASALFVALAGPGEPLSAAVTAILLAALTAGVVLIASRRRPVAEPWQTATGTFVPPPPAEHRRGLAVGELAPEFELAGPCGAVESLASLRGSGLPVVLLFLSGGCGSCRELHPHLHRWQVTLAEHVTLAVIMLGNEDAALTLCSEHEVENVLHDDRDTPLWHAYEMPGTPSGVVVAPDGRIASASVIGDRPLEELVRQTIRHGMQPSETWTQPAPVA